MSALSFKHATLAGLSKARAFADCVRGIAALEFAMVAPIMLLMFIGVVELSTGITVDRRVSSVASSTADLVARQKTVSTTQLDGYMAAITQIMEPFDAAPMKLTVANVYSTVAAPTVYKTCWHYHHNGGAKAGIQDGQVYPHSVPAGIVQGGQSVLIVEVSYAYVPAFIFGKTYVGSGITLSDRAYLKPRLTNVIQKTPAAPCNTAA